MKTAIQIANEYGHHKSLAEDIEEYAQQQSIAFYKYVNNERWVYSEGTDLWHLSQAHVPLTSSELYQQFLTE